MKNLKKLSRNELKKISGGKEYQDFCAPGNGFCEQFGLACGIFIHVQGGQTVGSNWACM